MRQPLALTLVMLLTWAGPVRPATASVPATPPSTPTAPAPGPERVEPEDPVEPPETASVASLPPERVTTQALRSLLLPAVLRTTRRSLQISLEELGSLDLATWVARQDLPAKLGGDQLGTLGEGLLDWLTAARALPGTTSTTLTVAYERSRDYLRLDSRPLIQELPLPHPDPEVHLPPETQWVENGGSGAATAVWPGVGAYTRSRLGPLAILVRQLDLGDRVLLTNVPPEQIVSRLPGVRRWRRIHLPLSSYGKQISLVEHTPREIPVPPGEPLEGGAPTPPRAPWTLVLSDFDSRSYLLHFGWMIHRLRQSADLRFEIGEHLDPERLRESYRQLQAFAEASPAPFRDLRALVVGYAQAFSRLWGDTLVETASQEGFPGENWEIRVYLRDGVGRVGVLGGDVDYYGEALARQLEELFRVAPVGAVFFGGSGGSLVPTPPYALVLPSFLQSPGGTRARNQLAGSGDAGVHHSVASPLQETPHALERWSARGITSVDLEAGHLADLAARGSVEVGVGILVTDYPSDAGNLAVTLGQQDFASKQSSRAAFVHAVERALRDRHASYRHPVETHANLSLGQLSRRNLEALRARMRPLSREELRLVRRLHAVPRNLVVRMSPGRLWWTLKDRALLSTGLVEAWGTRTTPFTPPLEHQVFGAFDYVFAQFSPQLGRRRYGDVVVLLDPAKILARSWGTRGSGWHLTRDLPEADLEAQRRRFGQEVFHPEHFHEVLGLQAVERFRSLPEEARRELVEARAGDLSRALEEHGVGYLEVKIRDYVLPGEIRRVLLPPEAKGEIPELLRSHDIPFERYDPEGHPH